MLDDDQEYRPEYKDKQLASDGISTSSAKASTENKSKIQLSGKGANVPLASLPLTGSVTAQFINTSSGVCFQSSSSAAQIRKNLSTQFSAKSP